MYKLFNEYYSDFDVNVSALAKYCGVTRQQMHKYLDCSVLPRVDVAIKMCCYLSSVWGFYVSITSLWDF